MVLKCTRFGPKWTRYTCSWLTPPPKKNSWFCAYCRLISARFCVAFWVASHQQLDFSVRVSIFPPPLYPVPAALGVMGEVVSIFNSAYFQKLQAGTRLDELPCTDYEYVWCILSTQICNTSTTGMHSTIIQHRPQPEGQQGNRAENI